MRTYAEIKQQVEGLRAIAAQPGFKDGEAVEAQVTAIEGQWTEGDLDGEATEEWSEDTHEAARQAIAWRVGESDATPVSGWQGKK